MSVAVGQMQLVDAELARLQGFEHRFTAIDYQGFGDALSEVGAVHGGHVVVIEGSLTSVNVFDVASGDTCLSSFKLFVLLD